MHLRALASQLCAVVVGLLFVGALPANAQTKPAVTTLASGQPGSAIFIGNSFFYYNNGMPAQVAGLMKSADAATRFRTSMVTIGGSGLDWHDVDSYFRPNAIAKYTFDENNVVVFNTHNKLFDIAVIMDCSQCPIHPQLKAAFEAHAKKNADSIRKNGAEPVLFMSWAYADKPEMTQQLAEAYTKAGNDLKALVIPAGLAFARAKEKRPDLTLYVADKRHPTPMGTYLAACTTYAALTGKSPAGLSYTAGLDPAAASALQTLA